MSDGTPYNFIVKPYLSYDGSGVPVGGHAKVASQTEDVRGSCVFIYLIYTYINIYNAINTNLQSPQTEQPLLQRAWFFAALRARGVDLRLARQELLRGHRGARRERTFRRRRWRRWRRWLRHARLDIGFRLDQVFRLSGVFRRRVVVRLRANNRGRSFLHRARLAHRRLRRTHTRRSVCEHHIVSVRSCACHAWRYGVARAMRDASNPRSTPTHPLVLAPLGVCACARDRTYGTSLLRHVTSYINVHIYTYINMYNTINVQLIG